MGAVHDPFIFPADTTGACRASRVMRGARGTVLCSHLLGLQTGHVGPVVTGGSQENPTADPERWPQRRWRTPGAGPHQPATGHLQQQASRRPGAGCSGAVGMSCCLHGSRENCAILGELVRLQAQKSRLLGFSTRADSVLEMNMAKTSQLVATFLDELAQKLKPLGEQEPVILELKKAECQRRGLHFDGPINTWDLRYYMNQGEETRYHEDQYLLNESFPMQVVTRRLLGIPQELLGLTFDLEEGTNVCHEDVRLYTVRDAASGKVIIGKFYLDLYPREGKSGHAACFGLQPGCLQHDGSRQIAIVAMVANFTKPTPDPPSLLQHDELETYFHEFWQAMHQLRSQSRWGTGSAVPQGLRDKLIKSRQANPGLFNLRQMVLAEVDQALHTQTPADPAKENARLCQEILGGPAMPGTHLPATFGRLAGRYNAQSCGYLCSEVYSADTFHTRFKQEGILSGKVAMDYRSCILRPGGSKDAKGMVKLFLVCDPTQDAFLLSKGLQVEGCKPPAC
ncbi:LOW QUALITY PROTEIN: thimet oligopeptidase-like [Megaptera novaeangliae]